MYIIWTNYLDKNNMGCALVGEKHQTITTKQKHNQHNFEWTMYVMFAKHCIWLVLKSSVRSSVWWLEMSKIHAEIQIYSNLSIFRVIWYFMSLGWFFNWHYLWISLQVLTFQLSKWQLLKQSLVWFTPQQIFDENIVMDGWNLDEKSFIKWQ